MIKVYERNPIAINLFNAIELSLLEG